MSCPSSESNSGLDADDTETSPDAEEEGYFVSREAGSFLVREKLLHALASVASQACLSACFALS